jgi:hypothetical protein
MKKPQAPRSCVLEFRPYGCFLFKMGVIDNPSEQCREIAAAVCKRKPRLSASKLTLRRKVFLAEALDLRVQPRSW